MKRVVFLLACFVPGTCCFSQSATAYKQYLKNLCMCYQKDTLTKNSMNDAGAALGKCINLADTSLRNKAMKEKSLLKTDTESLIQFEKLFAVDLLNECSAFETTIGKLSNNTKNKTIPKLPVVDTISGNVCSCLVSKGVSGERSVVIANISECLNSAMLKNYNEIMKQYDINDGNQEILSNIGELISKLVMANCRFYLEKMNPVLIKK